MNTSPQSDPERPHVFVHHRHSPYGTPPAGYGQQVDHHKHPRQHDEVERLADHLSALESELSRVRRRIDDLLGADD